MYSIELKVFAIFHVRVNLLSWAQGATSGYFMQLTFYDANILRDPEIYFFVLLIIHYLVVVLQRVRSLEILSVVFHTTIKIHNNLIFYNSCGYISEVNKGMTVILSRVRDDKLGTPLEFLYDLA